MQADRLVSYLKLGAVNSSLKDFDAFQLQDDNLPVFVEK